MTGKGTGGRMGVEGVARDMGTYKALVPILELAALQSDSEPKVPSAVDSPLPSAVSVSASSKSDVERARAALDTVRRIGRTEGLIF